MSQNLGTTPPPDAPVADAPQAAFPGRPSMSEIAAALPIAGLTRRRLALSAAMLAAVWVLVVLARQVGDASVVTARADALRYANASLRDGVAALADELAFIQRPEFVALQARSYRVGGRGEIPFTLDGSSAPLPADAPGSAAAALGAVTDETTPLESWLTVLFGPGD